MPVLQEPDRQAVRQRFDTELKHDVLIRMYTRSNAALYIPGRECEHCATTQQLLEEVSALSEHIDLQTIDLYSNTESALVLGVDRIPAVLIGPEGQDSVRYFGLPSGFEFPLLLDTIIASSEKRSALQLETRRQLKNLREDVRIRVFVTPSCQYCPAAGRLAHLMALESPRVTADVVEVQEFQDLARAYNLMSVPKTVINDRVQFVGAVTEEVMMERVLQAVGDAETDEEPAEQASDQVTVVR